MDCTIDTSVNNYQGLKENMLIYNFKRSIESNNFSYLVTYMKDSSDVSIEFNSKKVEYHRVSTNNLIYNINYIFEQLNTSEYEIQRVKELYDNKYIVYIILLKDQGSILVNLVLYYNISSNKLEVFQLY